MGCGRENSYQYQRDVGGCNSQMAVGDGRLDAAKYEEGGGMLYPCVPPVFSCPVSDAALNITDVFGLNFSAFAVE